mgnify:FL=1
MIPLFIEYLAVAGKLPLEGLGYLKLNQTPAQMDITTRLLEGPKQEYVFESFPAAMATPFFSWLNGHSQGSIANGESAYQELVKNVKQLEVNRTIEWKGIGIWRMNEAKNVEFEFNSLAFPPLKPIYAEKIVRNNAVHAIRVGELQSDSAEMTRRLAKKSTKFIPTHWLLFFLVLAIASVLSWYLVAGNMLPSSLSNPQKIVPSESTVQYRSL